MAIKWIICVIIFIFSPGNANLMDKNSHFLPSFLSLSETREETMVWKWLIYVTVIDFFPVYSNEDISSTRQADGVDMPCDGGWHHFREKCYKLGGMTYEARKSWQEAADICTTYGGHLVSINSKEELDFLVNNITMPFNDAAWIGLSDRDWESIYSWQDGSLVNYTNFLIGEPNHRVPDEDCIRMISFDPYIPRENAIGKWRDTICSQLYPYICQKKIGDSNEVFRTTLPYEDGNMPCDVGWHHFRQKCYKVEGTTYEARTSWQGAVNICSSYGGHLVSINAKVELDFLVNNIIMPLKDAVWIGLHDQNWNSMFSWQDGSPIDFTNWMDGQPNNTTLNENCVEMLYDLPKIDDNIIGQWRKYKCSLANSYICQKKAINDESENLPTSTSVYTNEVSSTTRSDEDGNKPCNVGWHHFRQKCYKHGGVTYDALKSWKGAANICTTYGGHLVSIHSKTELEFLVKNLLMPFKYNVWIGLHDRKLESIFTWQDGSSVNYTNFMIGEPNHRHSEEDCIVMLYNNPNRDEVLGQWKDVRCSLYYSYICQKKIVSPSEADENEILPSCTSGQSAFKALIGITIVLSLVLLGVVICYFCPWDKWSWGRSIQRTSNRIIQFSNNPMKSQLVDLPPTEDNKYRPMSELSNQSEEIRT